MPDWKYIGGGAAEHDATDDFSCAAGEINNPAISSIKIKANIDTKLRDIKEPLIEKMPILLNAQILASGINAMKVYGYEVKLIYVANDSGS